MTVSMEENPLRFRQGANEALADPDIQRAVGFISTGFSFVRSLAVQGLPEFEDLREEGKTIKNHVLANLDVYLEEFESKVVASGGQVHWAVDAEEARQAVLKICRRHNAKTVTKGKSMVTEEVHLNHFLEEQGLEPIETDLGEYIVQLAGERPSHIVGPAVHKTIGQVANLFEKHHADIEGIVHNPDDGEALVGEARHALRDKFVTADVGITGANFLVAETGSTVIVTNEGNGDLTQNQPKVHIVLATIEKVLPTLEDVSTILRLLARSATGQSTSVYTTFSTGPKKTDDPHGPDEFHVILLDNGRSSYLGTEFQDMLRCIRCGACMNHCPVYGVTGGFAYGSTYMGPMGSVITPMLQGIDKAHTLPNASTFCGRCHEVCPMKIPLHDMMRNWRAKAFEQGLSKPVERWGLKIWQWVARNPKRYRLFARIGARFLHHWGGSDGLIHRFPMLEHWTMVRDMPAPQGDTFMDEWAQRQNSSGGPS